MGEKEEKNGKEQSEERENLLEFGSAKAGGIYTMTIIGQIEGHQVLPETAKATKYEHVIPLLAQIEESREVEGLLLLLNTVGGDIEAGLAIAELIAGISGAGWRPLHRSPPGGQRPSQLYCSHGQHDHSSRADDGHGGGGAPDLPVF